MSKKVSVLACIFVLSVFACAAPVSTEPGRLPDSTVPFATRSGLTEKALIVIRDAEKWAESWMQLNSGRRPMPALPFIDFDENIVVIVAMGRQPSSGYAISITALESSDGLRRLLVTTTRPGKTCIVSTGLTSPVDVAILPRDDAEIVLVESEAVTEC